MQISLLAIGDLLNLQPLPPSRKLGGGARSSKLLIEAWYSWLPILKLSKGLIPPLEQKALLSPFTQETPRILEALYQELGTKTKYRT